MPRPRSSPFDGTLSLSNNLQGAAVLRAQNLAPGESAGGVVVLSNTGTLAGELDLTQTELTDTLGPAGGQLSHALQLTVRDVVRNAVVYQGLMSGLGTANLGEMSPGETRTYSFNLLLPDTGIPVSATTGDNAFTGAGVSVRYRWTLSGDEDGGGGGDGGGGSGGGTGRPSGGRPSGGGSGTTVSRMRVKIKVNAKKALKRGRVNVAVRCQEPCRIRAYAQLRKRRKMKTRRKSAVTRVANKRAVIKLKLPKKMRKNLKKRIAKKRKDYIVVYVRATDPRGGVVNLKKTVRVKAPKRKRR